MKSPSTSTPRQFAPRSLLKKINLAQALLDIGAVLFAIFFLAVAAFAVVGAPLLMLFATFD